jgi:thiol-disulfide isomerase/thioredoxin
MPAISGADSGSPVIPYRQHELDGGDSAALRSGEAEVSRQNPSPINPVAARAMMLVTKFAAECVRLCLAAGLLAASWTTGAVAQDASKQFIMHSQPKPVADIRFEDDKGQSRSLADFHSKIVLLNIWATWCIPCRKEMPALDRLQTTLGSGDFEVVPLSIDRGGMDVVRKFYGEMGLQKLGNYRDNSGGATRELGAVGIPTTLLIDRGGREIGRLIGPAEWDSPEMVEFIRCVISGGGEAQASKEAGRAAAPTCRT